MCIRDRYQAAEGDPEYSTSARLRVVYHLYNGSTVTRSYYGLSLIHIYALEKENCPLQKYAENSFFLNINRRILFLFLLQGCGTIGKGHQTVRDVDIFHCHIGEFDINIIVGEVEERPHTRCV